ncbi:hypothetical protein [Puia dinghuensis]|nr:hypothetical protein [Puia dinghuensis]
MESKILIASLTYCIQRWMACYRADILLTSLELKPKTITDDESNNLKPKAKELKIAENCILIFYLPIQKVKTPGSRAFEKN